MVDDLLEISRGTTRTGPPSSWSTSPSWSAPSPAHHGRLPPDVLDVAAHPWIVGDRRRLERVVVNLLDNAARHGKGLVRLGVLRRDGQARIEVDDAGPGVPAADREHVFERFARGSPADRGHDRQRRRPRPGAGRPARPRPRRACLGRGAPRWRRPVRRRAAGGGRMRVAAGRGRRGCVLLSCRRAGSARRTNRSSSRRAPTGTHGDTELRHRDEPTTEHPTARPDDVDVVACPVEQCAWLKYRQRGAA